MMTINNLKNVADKCKRYSHAVACYHKFRVCDRPLTITSPKYMDRSFSSNNDVISICRKDCDDLTVSLI